MSIFPPFLVFLICYVIGSFPTAYVIGRWHGINIFKVGSGNMGANNMTRALGLQWGVLVWAIDVCKGILAVFAARRLSLALSWDELAASIVGAIGVVVGHNWSFFASVITGTMRGGKGAATAGGTWLMLIPPQIFIVTVALWVLLVVGTRYVSLAVLVAFAVGTVWVMALVGQNVIAPAYSTYAVFVSALVYYRHRENIVALLHGRERRFMDRVKTNQ
jgi:glycerol-3-phosphate acyltransferase PlsY